MNEERFEFYSDEDLIGVIDTVTGRTFNSFEIVDCLNEQQSTIEAKNEYQRTLEAKIRRLKNRVKILEKAEGWQN